MLTFSETKYVTVETHNFMRFLREHGASRFLDPADDRFKELQSIADAAKANDAATAELIRLKPGNKKIYQERHAQAERGLEDRVLKLRIGATRSE